MWTYNYNYNNELYHFGIKGMKWGVRRYQNSDGSLTSAGRKRYSDAEQNYRDAKSAYKSANKEYRKTYKQSLRKSGAYENIRGAAKKANKAEADFNKAKQAREEYYKTPEGKKELAAKRAKTIAIGTAVAGTALAAYGAYKLNKYVKTKNQEIAAERGYNEAKKTFNTLVKDLGQSTLGNSGRISVNPGEYANSRARDASNNSFREAAKNVYRYKKQGGDLDTLAPVDFYSTMNPFELRWEKPKK